MKIRHRAVPEALLRDRLRDSWILVLPASEFIDGAEESGGTLPPRVRARRERIFAFEADDRPFVVAEILAMCALAAGLSWMLWSLGHL